MSCTVVMQPHPAQALAGCKAFPIWSGGGLWVPGLICCVPRCVALNDPAGKVCNDDDDPCDIMTVCAILSRCRQWQHRPTKP